MQVLRHRLLCGKWSDKYLKYKKKVAAVSGLKYWIWLSDARVSVKSKAVLLAQYGDAETAFRAPKGEFKNIRELNAADAQVLENRDMSRTEPILEQCRIQGISMITLQDAAYPKQLKHIFAPPAVLYVKGNEQILERLPAVAVIGTRKASTYGIKTARDISYEIAKCGGTVITLVSSRVDEAAAKGAMLAEGSCIGVLGTAHECETALLSKEIASRGVLVSEYAPGTASVRGFFRERNRVAAGLSSGVVVIEAPERSNTSLFVEEALEQGKELFAIPGNVDSVNSVGTNIMLKDGAKPVTSGWDVMCEFKAVYPEAVREAKSAVPVEKSQAAAESREKRKPDKKDIDKEKDRGYIDLKEQMLQLNVEQLKIVTAIGKEAKNIDDIIEETGLSTAKVLAQLTVLEIKGFVRRESGRRISLNTKKSEGS